MKPVATYRMGRVILMLAGLFGLAFVIGPFFGKVEEPKWLTGSVCVIMGGGVAFWSWTMFRRRLELFPDGSILFHKGKAVRKIETTDIREWIISGLEDNQFGVVLQDGKDWICRLRPEGNSRNSSKISPA